MQPNHVDCSYQFVLREVICNQRKAKRLPELATIGKILKKIHEAVQRREIYSKQKVIT